MFDTAYFSVPEYSHVENVNDDPTFEYQINSTYKIWKNYKNIWVQLFSSRINVYTILK